MRKIKVPTKEQKQIESLADENADLIIQNAMQDMDIKGLQDENASLMVKIAMLEAK
jgi:hypothetical protein